MNIPYYPENIYLNIHLWDGSDGRWMQLEPSACKDLTYLQGIVNLPPQKSQPLE